MRSVVGISGLKAGEDVNAFRIPEYRLETQGQSTFPWCSHWIPRTRVLADQGLLPLSLLAF